MLIEKILGRRPRKTGRKWYIRPEGEYVTSVALLYYAVVSTVKDDLSVRLVSYSGTFWLLLGSDKIFRWNFNSLFAGMGSIWVFLLNCFVMLGGLCTRSDLPSQGLSCV